MVFLLRVAFTQGFPSAPVPSWQHLADMALTGLAWRHKDGEGCRAGAQAINQQPLSRIEVHGKNLFYFFGEGDATVVLHIHFGMSGRFKTVVRGDTLPEPRETTRLVLIGDKVVAQLSAMIVQHGGLGAHAGSDEVRTFVSTTSVIVILK